MAELANLAVEADPDVPVAHLTGEIDLSNASAVAEDLAAAVPNTALGLVVDLSGVSYLDSSAIHALFGLARAMGRRQQALHLVVPSNSLLRRVLALAELASAVPSHEDLEAAVRAVRE